MIKTHVRDIDKELSIVMLYLNDPNDITMYYFYHYYHRQQQKLRMLSFYFAYNQKYPINVNLQNTYRKVLL